ncbi:unnamed protein product [Paramecium sonneborni]|uniref:Uncharacterized protein n=1 Tax=Paramecium sonneborni TaxID=65129 RepID=A0A8S1KVA1_9CILI|nr:unnamed protein product [Paramecium sonneborni]
MQNFKRVVILLSKTSGRDKSCRILQYFGKFCAEQLKELNQNELSLKCKNLSSNMSLTRKVLRFGRTIGIIISIIELSKSKGNKAIILNKILMNISCFLYFLVDHTHWFCKIQVIQNPILEAKADYWSDALWCFEAFFDCVALILEIKEEDNKTEDTKSPQRLFNLKLDLLRAFMDLLSAYGFISNGRVPGKWIGFFGTISSIIGLKQQWDAAK